MKILKTFIFAVVGISLLSLAGCGGAPDGKQSNTSKVKVSKPVKPIGKVSELVDLTPDQIKDRISLYEHPSSREFVVASAAQIIEQSGVHSVRHLANDLASGNGVKRNIAAANIVAYEAYKVSPKTWSAFKSVHGFLYGLGLKKDPAKALEILDSKEEYKDNVAGQYFYGIYYQDKGDIAEAKGYFERAAAKGHAGATRALKKMESN
jgi:TPR repeat protein